MAVASWILVLLNCMRKNLSCSIEETVRVDAW